MHALLTLTYAEAGDAFPAFTDWWAKLSTDAEFDAELCFLAFDRSEQLAGIAQCWSSAYLKDLAVRPDMRRRGLGEALLQHVFVVFRALGAHDVDLKVELKNSSAVRLYERNGMVRVAWDG